MRDSLSRLCGMVLGAIGSLAIGAATTFGVLALSRVQDTLRANVSAHFMASRMCMGKLNWLDSVRFRVHRRKAFPYLGSPWEGLQPRRLSTACLC